MADHECCPCADDLRAALDDYHAAFERILGLHGPKYGRPTSCKHCDRPWPCPTTLLALQPHKATA